MGRQVWVIGFFVRIEVPLLNQRYSSMAEQSHISVWKISQAIPFAHIAD
jgi:hypothetical protein